MSEESAKLEISIIPKFLDSALTPVAKEAGERLADIVSLVFTPIIKAKAKRDKNIELFLKELDEKVNKIPEEHLTEPPLSIVGPALDNVFKFYHNEEHLRQMYSTLIASSMTSESKVHPSYIDIIRQLSKQDALVFSSLLMPTHFDGNRFLANIIFCFSIEYDYGQYSLDSMSIDYPLFLLKDEKLFSFNTPAIHSLYSLKRLGLIDIKRDRQSINSLSEYNVAIKEEDDTHPWYVCKNGIILTQFGLDFAHICCDEAVSEEILINDQDKYLKEVVFNFDFITLS